MEFTYPGNNRLLLWCCQFRIDGQRDDLLRDSLRVQERSGGDAIPIGGLEMHWDGTMDTSSHASRTKVPQEFVTLTAVFTAHHVKVKDMVRTLPLPR